MEAKLFSILGEEQIQEINSQTERFAKSPLGLEMSGVVDFFRYNRRVKLFKYLLFAYYEMKSSSSQESEGFLKKLEEDEIENPSEMIEFLVNRIDAQMMRCANRGIKTSNSRSC